MYHYTESGLRNVWLANGYKIRNVGGEEAVAIHDVDELHRTIGRNLARKSRLTGAELRFLRKEMGLSQNRSEEHTSELQSLMRISYAVFCLKKKNIKQEKPAARIHK